MGVAVGGTLVGSGVNVGVRVGDGVVVRDSTGVAVSVADGVAVAVGVSVGVGVGERVGVSIGVAVVVDVGVSEGRAVGVVVAVAVGSGVGVGARTIRRIERATGTSPDRARTRTVSPIPGSPLISVLLFTVTVNSPTVHLDSLMSLMRPRHSTSTGRFMAMTV